MKNYNKILYSFDLLMLSSIIVSLIIAFAYQIIGNDFPCSLCVMLRMGLYAMGFGLFLNITKERSQNNYFIVIISSLISSIISLEFVIRHIVPGSGSYGSAIFNIHMYSWNFLLTTMMIGYASIAGLITREKTKPLYRSKLSKIIIFLLLATLVANIISAFFECGPYLCPSDPHSYWLIEKLHGRPWF